MTGRTSSARWEPGVLGAFTTRTVPGAMPFAERQHAGILFFQRPHPEVERRIWGSVTSDEDEGLLRMSIFFCGVQRDDLPG